MSTMSISTLRTNLYRAAEEVIDSHEPLTVTSKKGDLIMMSAEDYENLQETMIVLSSMPGILDDIKSVEDGTMEVFGREALPW